MSAQLAIEFAEPVKVPDAETHCGILLRAFKRGERLTMRDALLQYGIGALSQRCGDLRRNGWPICTEMVEVKPGTRAACYWMEPQ